LSDDVVREQFVDGSHYPPGLTGLRGSHPGSFEVAHAIRDGDRFDVSGLPVEEQVDLVVVGAGISGLAAARLFRERRPEASILLLDNHDDFGGHAKRNEFEVQGRFLIGYGGSESMQSPDTLYSEAAMGMLRRLGVDHRRFHRYFHTDLYPSLGLSRGLFFTREAFGRDVLVTGDPMRMVADDVPADRMHERSPVAFIADFPVSDATKAALVDLHTSTRDPLGGMPPPEAAAYLGTLSYRDYLVRYFGVGDEGTDTFQGRSHDFFARGIDAITAYAAMETGYPGFAGVHVPPDPVAEAEMDEPYVFHFPDGNASIARLLVRSLVPSVAPGSTMEDVVTARFDYGRLDEPGSLTRLRLSSTVVHVANEGDGVDVGYVRAGTLHRVRADRCVLAGYHMMLPAIVRDLPAEQAEALAGNVKAPLAYVNVAVRDWRPWVHLGVHEITSPMGFFSRLKLDYPVSIGDYRFPTSADEPMVLHLVHVPTVPHRGLPLRLAYRRARSRLYATSFATFEERVRDELSRMLGPGGFDADRDVAAITVNRWGHGYSYGGDRLHDPLPEGAPAPYEVARRPLGRIAIANADAAWTALASAAIDQAHRAVGEILAAG
jgi:spermidine dehydrogenase